MKKLDNDGGVTGWTALAWGHKKYVKFTPKGFGSVICKPEDVVDYIELSEVGDNITLEIIAMLPAQYDKLPEFEGF